MAFRTKISYQFEELRFSVDGFLFNLKYLSPHCEPGTEKYF